MTQQPTRIFNQQDAIALCALAVSFAAMIAGTWQRWTQPLIDHGREMNLPARIAAGERLYVDVQFLYGPLAPHVNAALYKIFGVHLAVLKVGGVICAAVILLLIYWIARRLMNVWEAAATTALVLAICALKSTANYVQPYAYAALYALALSLGSLVATLSYLKRRSEYRLQAASAEKAGTSKQSAPPEGGTLIAVSLRLALAGVLAGLALISKPEMALAALVAGAAALIVESVAERRVVWRDGLRFALPVATIFIATYAVVLSRVPWRVLVNDNHVAFVTMPPQLIYFNRQISGLATWPRSFWFTVAGLGVFLVWLGAGIFLGALLQRLLASVRASSLPDEQPSSNRPLPTALVGLAILVVGVVWQWTTIKLGRVKGEPTPFASAALVLPPLITALGWRVWRSRREVSFRDDALLVVSSFALAAILRAILNVTIAGPYTPFFLPGVIVVYLYLLFRVAPDWCLRRRDVAARLATRRVAIGLILLMAIGIGVNSVWRLRRVNTFTVRTARGEFVTAPEYGQPMAEAIRYVQQRTRPGDYVLALPQATTINFMADRPYPLREEIVHPGFLAGAKEDAAIERIAALKIPLILIAYLETSEFGAPWFGESYNQKLMEWIAANYRRTARFEYTAGPPSPLGKRPFYIEAYEIK